MHFAITSRVLRQGDRVISLEIVVTILVLLPLLAAVMLGVFAASLIPLRKIPAHEYQQLVRAPAWIVVVTGGGLLVLSLLALGQMGGQGAQIFVGGRHAALLMIDAYSLWGSALLGMVLAVTAWAPAARRSLLPRAVPYFLTVLLLTWLALLLLFSQQLGLSLFSWLLLLAGVMVFCAVLFRPGWHWEQLEVFLVLALAGLLGGIGLVWLHTLAKGSMVTNMWTVLLSSPPHATNAAMLLIAIGWIGPAIYLPWWLWVRREEEAAVWLPAAMLLAVAGVLASVRLIFFLFPAGGGNFSQIPGVEHLFLIRQILGWLLAWGVVALLVGAGLQTYFAIRRRYDAVGLFRPLVLVASGMLLLGIAGGILGMADEQLGHRTEAITGLIWTLLTWSGMITVWLVIGLLLPMLTAKQEGAERTTLQVSLWLTMASLVAIPPSSGFHALASFWVIWGQHGTPPILVLTALLLTLAGVIMLLPRWSRRQVAEEPHPGAGWGLSLIHI